MSRVPLNQEVEMGAMKNISMQIEEEFYNALEAGAITENDVASYIHQMRDDLVLENLDGIISDLYERFVNSERKVA